DDLEAHRLFRAAGRFKAAGTLIMRITVPLRRFGLYSLLRELCVTILRDPHDNDEWLTANADYQLGALARLQGHYEEARRRYQQSLALFEQLGDQHGQASALHQLGALAQD